MFRAFRKKIKNFLHNSMNLYEALDKIEENKMDPW